MPIAVSHQKVLRITLSDISEDVWRRGGRLDEIPPLLELGATTCATSVRPGRPYRTLAVAFP